MRGVGDLADGVFFEGDGGLDHPPFVFGGGLRVKREFRLAGELGEDRRAVAGDGEDGGGPVLVAAEDGVELGIGEQDFRSGEAGCGE